MAPAAITLNATQGFSTVSMKAAVSSGLLHHMLSLFALWSAEPAASSRIPCALSSGVADQ